MVRTFVRHDTKKMTTCFVASILCVGLFAGGYIATQGIVPPPPTNSVYTNSPTSSPTSSPTVYPNSTYHTESSSVGLLVQSLFNNSYASLDVSGNGSIIVVGNQYDGYGSGSITTFRWDGTSVDKISNLEHPDGKGVSVAVSDDASVIASCVGPPSNVSVAIYVWDGDDWTLQTLWTGGDDLPQYYCEMDNQLAVGGDYVATSSYTSNPQIGWGGGFVIVLKRRSRDVWTLDSTIETPDGYEDAAFGFSMDMDSTGSRIVVGIPFDYSLSSNFYYPNGNVAVYARNDTGSFVLETMLETDGDPGTILLGFHVAIDPDGRFIVASASYGTVFVYQLTQGWHRLAQTVPPFDATSTNDAPYVVSIQRGGLYFAVGDSNNGDSSHYGLDFGSVWVYGWNGTGYAQIDDGILGDDPLENMIYRGTGVRLTTNNLVFSGMASLEYSDDAAIWVFV